MTWGGEKRVFEELFLELKGPKFVGSILKLGI